MVVVATAVATNSVKHVLKNIRYASDAHVAGNLGSVYDVIRLTTGQSKAKLPRVYDSLSASFPELFEDVVRVKFAGRGQRPTPCMPPDRLHTLARFMFDRKRVSVKSVKNTTTRGVVYVATAPVLLACKIGMWRGKLSQLRNRYVTSYGGDLRLDVYEFCDCVSVEKLVHTRFAPRRIVGELYALDGLDEYRAWLQEAAVSASWIGMKFGVEAV